jgi:uncharacterized protein (TIGR00369 family)
MPAVTLDAARRFVDALPHSRALGMRLVGVGDGRAEVHMDWDARLVGDPASGVIHGGAVSALMDTCAGTAVLAAGTGAVATATLDLRIDYMRPATPGQTIRATAMCTTSPAAWPSCAPPRPMTTRAAPWPRRPGPSRWNALRPKPRPPHEAPRSRAGRQGPSRRRLKALAGSVPYIAFLGIQFDRRGDEITAILPFRDDLIGNPMLPALHGGATAAFLEVTAIIDLSFAMLWEDIESGALDAPALTADTLPRLPRTIDFTVDYLRAGLPRDAYARARVNRSGRRYASVHVEAWQDNRARPFAQGTGHFLMPSPDDATG